MIFILESGKPGETKVVPAISALLRHTSRPETFVFDLGVHKDWDALSPGWRDQLLSMGADMQVPEDVPEALRKGGLDPADIDYACISHCHIDHIGDPTKFSKATYLVGSDARALLDPASGHPQDFAMKLFAALPTERTRYLDPAGWPALGPFAHALDFYGDGSLYVVDAPGHLAGHINVLARTSADGGWIYLAGDSAHDWSLIHGTDRIAREPMCIHTDPAEAEAQMGRIRKLRENPRVRVLLAHDGPWYEENKGGSAYFPGDIPSL